MKTRLIKITNDNSRMILFLNREEMKAFILTFKNMDELKEYFSNGEECVFQLLTTDNKGYTNLDNFYFADDLYLDLFSNNELVSDLLESCPDIFKGSLKERMVTSLNGSVPNSIHNRNVRALVNELEKGSLKDHSVEIASVLCSLENEENRRKILKLVDTNI